MRYSRLLIAGTQSGVGKTPVTLARLAAFRVKGKRIQPLSYLGELTDVRDRSCGQDGIRSGKVVAFYTHLHFRSQPSLAASLVRAGRGEFK